MFGKFNDQDRVLAGQADQNDQPDLREDVVIAAFEPNSGDREEQTHRDDQNDSQRQPEAFVLGGQHEKDQQNTEWINVDSGVSGDNSLIGQLGPFVGQTFG